jgi:O-methyltransferase
MKKKIAKVIESLGYSVKKIHSLEKQYADITEKEFWTIFNACSPYTMTSVERMYSLYTSVAYVLDNKIAGDFVECGVWRGGSSMLIGFMLRNRGISDRKLYLYDTFEGMSEPTEEDIDLGGKDAADLMDQSVNDKETSVWCLADLNDVQTNMRLTQYKEGQIVYVIGKVEDTIPQTMPALSIALLRLDTDWYESTKHELDHLFPKLAPKGVLIIDDYGHWQGCRKAVDEYFAAHNVKMLLNRVDYTGRAGVNC